MQPISYLVVRSPWVLAVLLIGLRSLWAAEVPEKVAESACTGMARHMLGHWPDATTRIEESRWVTAGPLALPGNAMQPPHSASVPAHCDLIGSLQQRIGELGQSYAIRFHLRLPLEWNGRSFFQGGAGSNGELGDALGMYTAKGLPALGQGYAVVSQDSGHDNARNDDGNHAGTLVFGFDPIARSNYGHAALPLVADASQAAIVAFYGRPAEYRYFVGCSKGGEEAMAAAQRYADRFEGIAAGAPGLALPRAALAEAWDTQQFARLLPRDAGKSPSFQDLPTVFSEADFYVVRQSVLAACDALDGAVDGMVSMPTACTTRRVLRELRKRQCKGEEASRCLTREKITVLKAVIGGARDAAGRALYSDWPWDPGIAEPGWRIWKIGGAGGMPPALNVMLGAASLASVFTVPPTAVPENPQSLFNWQLAFDLRHESHRIHDTNGQFGHSAWEDVSAHSPDLDRLKARGARLLVWHGLADPVFSANDTAAWWSEVHNRYGGAEHEFLRYYAVPGLNHCGGGPATGQFDVLALLVAWVERGRAPDALLARADESTPWPGRERPLCAWPSVAWYRGNGSLEKSDNFLCRLPVPDH